MQLDATRCSRICMELSDSNPPDGLDRCLVMWWIAVLPMAAIIRKPLSPWHSSLLPLKQRPCEKSIQIGFKEFCESVSHSLREEETADTAVTNTNVKYLWTTVSCCVYCLYWPSQLDLLVYNELAMSLASDHLPNPRHQLHSWQYDAALLCPQPLHSMFVPLLYSLPWLALQELHRIPQYPTTHPTPLYMITHFPVILNCLCVILYITPLHIWSGTCLRLYILIQIHDCYIVIWE